MNESHLGTLLEKLQNNQLSDHESRELMQWFNEDESRVAAFADELRMSNSLAALQVLDSDGIVPAVIDSLSRAGVAADVSGIVRRQIETGLHSIGPAKHSQRSSRKWVAVLIALAATVLLCLGWFALPTGDTAGNSSAVIAHVTHQVDAIWMNDHVSDDGGVKAGLFELNSGFVRLDFDIMIGGSMINLDEHSTKLLTSPEMLACVRNGVSGKLLHAEGDIEAWNAVRMNDAEYGFISYDYQKEGWLALFNRSEETQSVELAGKYASIFSSKDYTLHDIWKNELIEFSKKGKPASFEIEPNGAVFLKYVEK